MEKLIIPSLLSVSDGILISERVLDATRSLTVADPKLLALFTKTESIFDRIVKNQNYSSKSLLTDDLIELDKRRDNAFIALRDILHGMSVSLIVAYSSKAEILNAIVKKHGNKIYAMGYKKKTSSLISLFSEFDLAVNHTLLADLGLVVFYDSLKAAQAAFETMSKQKSDEKAVKTNDSEPATDIMAELAPALTDLLALIQINNQLDPTTYGAIYNQLVTFITEVNTAARARKTRKQNGTSDDKPETPTI
jgi:hypothetical protein